MEQSKKVIVATLPKNGKSETKQPSDLIQKMETPVIPKQVDEEGEQQSFEDRMHRLNILFELQSKHTKLTETAAKLNKFVIKGNEAATLTLEDSEDNEFLTRNSEIISEVVVFVKEIVNKKRLQLEEQIKF